MQNTTVNDTDKSIKKDKPSTFLGWIKGFFYLLTGECIEELFEQLIEEGLVQGFAVAFSYTIVNVIVVFVSVQGIKSLSKVLIKVLIIIIKPIIKKYTFKEGTDKVEKLKVLFKKLGDELATNPKAIGGIVINGGVFSALAIFMQYLLQMKLPLWASILITIIVCASLLVFMIYLLVKYVHEKPLSKEERDVIREQRLINKQAENKIKAQEREQKKIELEAIKKEKEDAKKKEQEEHERLVLEEMNRRKEREQQQSQQ